LVANEAFSNLQNRIDRDLVKELKQRKDDLLPGLHYVKKVEIGD
jgi:hypothetical protein